jgi:hypothetical protein
VSLKLPSIFISVSTHTLDTSHKPRQCVFIGYSSLHKGYKCLDMDTGLVYLSRDVIFDEGIFLSQILHLPLHNNPRAMTVLIGTLNF